MAALFPSQDYAPVTFDEAVMASPLLDLSQGRPRVIVAASNGVIAALDAESGESVWKVDAPVPDGQSAQLLSTPVIIGDRLVILYQSLEQGVRTGHRMAVVDMTQKQVDGAFPVLVLYAEKAGADGNSTVKFNPPTAFSHAALQHAVKPGAKLGSVYASFGNAGDTQPFHGWLFEVDLDAWKAKGAEYAVTGVLLTTPEPECPVTIEYGTQEMICGGGIWTPAGPQIYKAADRYEVMVPTGNGQIDLARADYAKFDSGCDALQCANFDSANPDPGCLESCKNLFIPRPASGDKPLKPSNRECDDKSFWECLAWMDYDLGANAPVKADMASGRSVLIQPGKEGAVYLIDADQMGIQYDRLQIADLCGTETDPCRTPWSGMIVTQPVLSYLDNEPVVVIPTFMPDKSHPAGLVALKIVLENGSPKFKRYWQFPDPASAEAVRLFRSHPSMPALSTGKNGDAIVWIVDIGLHGTIYGVRVKDGKLIAQQAMQGTGRPLSAPLIYGDHLYAASTMPDTKKSLLEGFKMIEE
ncbi:MAG: hypothetical protein ACU83O_05805 [Gammaproteobacteria bacterium]